MTPDQLIESECKKSQSAYFHKSEIKPLINKILKSKNMENPEDKFISLGIATTIGELRALIKDYPDDTSFGFVNQPMQELFTRKFQDFNFVGFQPPDEFEGMTVEEIIEKLQNKLP